MDGDEEAHLPSFCLADERLIIAPPPRPVQNSPKSPCWSQRDVLGVNTLETAWGKNSDSIPSPVANIAPWFCNINEEADGNDKSTGFGRH